MKKTISLRLFKALQSGKGQLSAEALGKVVEFVESQKTEDQSFIDKRGKPDLYYTAFGWTLCYVLGIKVDTRKGKSYLEKYKNESHDLIHYAAFMRCKMILRLMKLGKPGFLLSSVFPERIVPLEHFESVPHGDFSSPYTQFIWLGLLEDSRNKIQERNTILNSLSSYRAANGGYMNTVNGLEATTNATTAALAVRGQIAGFKDNDDVHFLRDLQEVSGGFRAAGASPVPDLLSTATALFALNCYGLQPKFEVQDFIEAHFLESGGFSATLLDETSDVEYTFYGLLALGAINK